MKIEEYKAWNFQKAVFEIAYDKNMLSFDKNLWKKGFPFQTLNFEVGTEQKLHSDTIP